MKSEFEMGRALGYHEGRQSVYAELEQAYRRGLEHGLTAAATTRQRTDERPTRAEALAEETPT